MCSIFTIVQSLFTRTIFLNTFWYDRVECNGSKVRINIIISVILIGYRFYWRKLCIPRKLLAQKIEWLNDVKWGVRNGNIIRRLFLCNSLCRSTHTVTGDSSLHHTPHLYWSSVYPSLNSLLTRESSECTGAQWQLKRTVVSMYSRDKAVAVNTRWQATVPCYRHHTQYWSVYLSTCFYSSRQQ